MAHAERWMKLSNKPKKLTDNQLVKNSSLWEPICSFVHKIEPLDLVLNQLYLQPTFSSHAFKIHVTNSAEYQDNG